MIALRRIDTRQARLTAIADRYVWMAAALNDAQHRALRGMIDAGLGHMLPSDVPAKLARDQQRAEHFQARAGKLWELAYPRS